MNLDFELGVRWYDRSLSNAIGLRDYPRLVHAVVGGFTAANTSLLVINPDFHFVLAMDVIVCTAGVRNVLWTSVCTRPPILEAEVL